MTIEHQPRTLRDELAMTALSALICAPLTRARTQWHDAANPLRSFAVRAYQYADAMLEIRALDNAAFDKLVLMRDGKLPDVEPLDEEPKR